MKKTPFIIAEIGSNHNQDFETALKLIDIAKNSGANAVKFQIFKAKELYPKNIKFQKIFKKYEFKLSWYNKLKKYCKKRKIILFASTFGISSTNFLMKQNAPIIKWASSELTKTRELFHAASFNKPMIISTGMADLAEVFEAVEICKAAGNKKISLLHSRSLYPTDSTEVDILAIRSLKNIFKCPVGFSDHTIGLTGSIMAVALGATIFEKHITLNKKDKGPDHFYAMEPEEFNEYVKKIKESFKMLGSENINFIEKIKLQARKKSYFFNSNFPKWKIIKKKNIKLKDNALGLPERFISSIIGAKLKKKVKKDQPVVWNLF